MQLRDGHGSDLINILITDGHGQGFLFQAHAAAFLTGRDTHKGLILLFDHVRTRLPVFPFHIFDQAFEGNGIDSLPPLSFVVNVHFPAIRTVTDRILRFLRQFLKRRVHTEFVFFGQRLQKRVGKTALVLAGLPSHHGNGAIV